MSANYPKAAAFCGKTIRAEGAKKRLMGGAFIPIRRKMTVRIYITRHETSAVTTEQVTQHLADASNETPTKDTLKLEKGLHNIS